MSFKIEWIVNVKCNREVKDNKIKVLLNLVRKRNSIFLLVFWDIYWFYIIFRDYKFLIMYLI